MKTKERLFALFLILVFISTPIAAQQKRQTPRPPTPAPAVEQAVTPAVTFDTLLTQDSYRIYSEIRSVGQFVRSTGFNDLLEPIVKLGDPPKEFRTLLKWMNAHAEALANSRMFAASWPAKPKLPTVLIAVEFSTVDEAKKFEAELRTFMPKIMPKPSPTPASSPGPGNVQTAPTAPVPFEMVAPEPPQYIIKQTGSLVMLTDKPLSLRDLKPRGSKLLAEDPNFTVARNRLAAESVFVYVDVKSIEREQEQQRKKWEEEELKRREAEAANPPEPEVATPEPEELAPQIAPEPVPVPDPAPTGSPGDPRTSVELAVGTANNPEFTLSGSPGSEPIDGMMFSLWSLIFGGQPKWPEAVGVGIAFEDEGYVVRALIMDSQENKANAIPFVPQFASGPALAPGSPNVMPADTDLFISLSLDFVHMYDSMVKSMATAEELSRKGQPQSVAAPPPSSPFAAYEKRLGIKFKDDILPLLGNELAMGMPRKQPQPSPTPSPVSTLAPSHEDGPTVVKAPDQTPIFAIAVKDKEAVRRLIPKIVEGMAGKAANLFAQTEKHGDAEITSYANIFSYAFIGDFLVLTPDPTLTRRVVDAHVSNQTLSSDSHFRNSTRWQPRQVQGQVYAGPSVMDLVNPFATGGMVDEKMQNVLARMNPVIDPLTYSLSNDGLGPMHELHLPKNLLMLMIAGMTSQAGEHPIITNESIAKSLLRTIASAEATFQSGKGNGRYGTLEELAEEGLIAKDLFEKHGYKIELNVLSNKFEATAIPIEYGKSGRQSYFVDESGVLRGADHGGGAATISDKPVEY